LNLPTRVVRAVGRRAERYLWRTPKLLAKRVEFEALVRLGTLQPRTSFNRILDDRARFEYSGVIKELKTLCPDVFARKIARANVQQAFVFDTVRHFARALSEPRLLCVGSFEDTAAIALRNSGFKFDEIDPVVNKLDLNTFYNLPTTKPQTYDIVFSTSVLEHVKDDETFMNQIAELLAPNGVGVLTCDFKEGYKVGDAVIGGDYRFYTRDDLSRRLHGVLKDCAFVDSPRWDCQSPDFELGGFKYTFATMVFRKNAS
jgi:SAM-dependent methyltransferase